MRIILALLFLTLSAHLRAADIAFVDAGVKALCVANWDTSGDSGSRSATAAVVVSQKMPLKFGG